MADTVEQVTTLAILSGSSEAAAYLTPLEENIALTDSFARYHTGTVEMPINPELLNQLAELRAFVLTQEFIKLASFIKVLQQPFYITTNNVPTLFLNPSVLAPLVPYCDSPKDVTEAQLSSAKMEIEMLGDVPAIQGIPVWERLDGERVDFFNLFKLYRDMRYGVLTTGDFVTRPRSIAGVGRLTQLNPQLLSTLDKLYNWQARCVYYDNFMEVARQKRRAQEIQLLENDHLTLANKLMKKAEKYLDEKMNSLKPSEVIDMMEMSMKFARISLGLQGDKPGAPVNSKVSIYNTQNNQAEQMIVAGNGNSGAGQSAVEKQLNEDMKSESNLLSILHVLQQSGAMATVLPQQKEIDSSLDVEYRVLEDINDAAAEEGVDA